MSYTLVRNGLLTEQAPSDKKIGGYLYFKVSPDGQPNPRNPNGTGNGDGDHFDLISHVFDYVVRNYTSIDYLYIELLPGVYDDPCDAGYIDEPEKGNLLLPGNCKWVDISGIDENGDYPTTEYFAYYTIPAAMYGSASLYLMTVEFNCHRIGIKGSVSMAGPMDINANPPWNSGVMDVEGGNAWFTGDINFNMLRPNCGYVLSFRGSYGTGGYAAKPANLTLSCATEKAGHTPLQFDGCNLDIQHWNIIGVNIHASNPVKVIAASVVSDPMSITGIAAGMTFDGTCGLTRDQHAAIV